MRYCLLLVLMLLVVFCLLVVVGDFIGVGVLACVCLWVLVFAIREFSVGCCSCYVGLVSAYLLFCWCFNSVGDFSSFVF